jgi:hypothetical protein
MFPIWVITVFYNCSSGVDIDKRRFYCESDKECASGYICVNNECIKKGTATDTGIRVCRIDEDCFSGERCVEGRCKVEFGDGGLDVKDLIEDAGVDIEDILEDGTSIGEDGGVDVISDVEDVIDIVSDTGCKNECYTAGKVVCAGEDGYRECINSEDGYMIWSNKRYCSEPPKNYCVDSKKLRVYDTSGKCVNDRCEYGYNDKDCLNGCENGMCKNCAPDCSNKECGDDGCGGSCGSCVNNSICSNFRCICDFGYENCDGNKNNGCETDILRDTQNCGGCGRVCNLPNTLLSGCAGGECKVISCKTGYGNCDGIDNNGCEVNLTNNPNNCGSCGNSCGANANCSNGSCVCNSGYGNCDSSWSNGCEVNLNSVNTCGKDCMSIINCGPNTVCNSGVCNCIAGYFDCNSSYSDGCETKGDNKIIWNKTFGSSNNDKGTIVSIDPSDNVIITGGFMSPSIDFGKGNHTNSGAYDTFLAKFDSTGKTLWSRAFGGDQNDWGSFVKTDSSGNIYFLGQFRSSSISFGGGILSNSGGDCDGLPCTDIFFVKLDSNGGHIWSKKFGGNHYESGESIALDSLNNVYITGHTDSPSINFGGQDLPAYGGDDIYLAKFDSNGVHRWSKRFGGSDYDWVHSVVVDSSDNVYLAGDFKSQSISFGGNPLNNVDQTLSSGDLFVAKFDSNGNHLWSKRFGGDDHDIIYSLAVDRSNNIYITGSFKSTSITFGQTTITNASSKNEDIFLVKLDSNGNVVWAKGFGGSLNDVARYVSVDSSGSVYITGYFFSSTINFGGGTLTNSGGDDIFLVRFDSNGNHLWSKRFGGSNYDESYCISVDNTGNLYIIGGFSSSDINFGGCPSSNAGGSDIFIIKHAP